MNATTRCWKCRYPFVPVDVSGIGDGDRVCVTCGASETPPRPGHHFVAEDSDETPHSGNGAHVSVFATPVVLWEWPERWTSEDEAPTRIKHVIVVHWEHIRHPGHMGKKPYHVIAIEGLAEIKYRVRYHPELHRITVLVLKMFCRSAQIAPQEIRGLIHFGLNALPEEMQDA